MSSYRSLLSEAYTGLVLIVRTETSGGFLIVSPSAAESVYQPDIGIKIFLGIL